MQFIEGQTLQSFPRNDPKAIAEILRQAALAVQFAHEQGVIHRDLKPANIMVVGGGKAPTTRRVPGAPRAPRVQAYVMDFGLAKATNLDSKLSVSGAIMGTPAYMSPEQARGSSKLGPRTDVYSLGATLYEPLANRPPFRAATTYDLLKKVVEEDPRPIEGDLGTIAMKCLEKVPARRYLSAQELADDLGRFIAGEAILAHPPSTLYRLQKFSSKHARVLVTAGLGLIGAIATAAVLVPRWREESRARQSEESQRRSAEKTATQEKERASEAEQKATKEGERAKEAEQKATQEGERASAAERREKEVGLYSSLAGKLDVLRMRFYQPDYALTDDEFARYARFEADVRGQMKQTGESAQAHYLIGRCREAQADDDGALEEYEKAIALDPEHPGSLLRKGRLMIEEALFERSFARSDEGLMKAAITRAEEATQCVKRGANAGKE